MKSLEVFITLETWDIDDLLMLLFLGHYHQLGRLRILGAEINRGTLEQNFLVYQVLRKASLEVPLFSRNEEAPGEVPDYYYGVLGFERGTLELPSREEACEFLKKREFKLLVGGGLSFARFLLERKVVPCEVFVQGGFAGFNVTGKPSKKFGRKNFVATFNFNKELRDTLRFLELKREHSFPLYLVSKNVNHLILVREEFLPKGASTPAGRFYLELLSLYLRRVRREKSLHDVYAAVALLKRDLFTWKEILPLYRPGRKYPLWGSTEGKTGIFITVGAREKEVSDYALLRRELT